MDELLINGAKQGDQDALARLLYNNYDIVFKHMIKFTFNKNIAEDLVQETMVRAIKKINLYNPEKAKFSTWLITIAQNLYLDNLRKKKNEHKYIVEDAHSLDLVGLTYERDDSWDELLGAIGNLTEESRLPLVLKHYYGYSYEEIASLMSIPLGTVKSRIHNAIKILRKELE